MFGADQVIELVLASRSHSNSGSRSHQLLTADASRPSAKKSEKNDTNDTVQDIKTQKNNGTNNDNGNGNISNGRFTLPEGCNSVVLYRHYDPPKDRTGDSLQGAKRMNQYAEAVLHKVLSLDHVPSMMMAMNGEWIIKEGGHIRLDGDVDLVVTRIERRDWDVTAVELTLFSMRKSATQLVRFIETLYEEYDKQITNELGSKLYYFDQRERKDFRGNPFDGKSRMDTRKFDIINAPQNLSFTRMPFYSNKSFGNLIGPEIEQLRDRVDFFMTRRDWYDEKGLPYQFGVLMSGEPGTGKSSCIRAMAKRTRRHIINVNFANIKTATQLKRLFYSEDLYVIDDDDQRDSVKLRIPIADRMFVLEELDALGTTVIDRENREAAAHAMDDFDDVDREPLHDEITLGVLLQVLDGNMEIPGRIIVVTTNRPKVLDRALVRPGRFDINIHFDNATRESLARMYENLHDVAFPEDRVAELPDRVVSPADATEIMFRHRNDVDAYVTETNKLANSVQRQREEKETAVREHLANVVVMHEKEAKRQAIREAKEAELNMRSVDAVASSAF